MPQVKLDKPIKRAKNLSEACGKSTTANSINMAMLLRIKTIEVTCLFIKYIFNG